MALSLYLDHHITGAITDGLRRRGVDVLTAHEDGSHEIDDPLLLDRASALQRLLVTQDSDLLVEAARRQRAGSFFYGVVHSRQSILTIGRAIQDLELIAKIYEPEDVINRVIYLPL